MYASVHSIPKVGSFFKAWSTFRILHARCQYESTLRLLRLTEKLPSRAKYIDRIDGEFFIHVRIMKVFYARSLRQYHSCLACF